MTPEEIYQKYGEALVIMGAGGPAEDWVKGIAQLLVDDGITREKNPFAVWKQLPDVIQVGERTDLILHFDPKKIKLGKLAIWRIRNRNLFDIMWLSDYIDQRIPA